MDLCPSVAEPRNESAPAGLNPVPELVFDAFNYQDEITWILRTGAPWADLPDRYPSYQTCHRRFQQWVQAGVMRGILEALAAEFKIHGVIDVEGELCSIEKRGSKIGKTKRGKGSKIMAVDRHGLPVAICVENATPHAVKSATHTLGQVVIPDAPQNLN
jgi:hypothetical protein